MMQRLGIKKWETGSQTREESWSDCVSGVSRGTHWAYGATHCEEALVPAVTVLGSGNVTDRVAPKWSDKESSLIHTSV